MKKLILSLAVISALSVGAFAQKSGNKGGKRDFNPEKMAEKRSEKLKADLKLTEQQFAAVTKLNKESVANREAERKEMKAKHDAKKSAYKNEMKKILTPEQYKTFEEKMATNEARRKEGMRKGSRGGKHAGPHHGARPENKG
jgi:Spy/CpxP family protein refolding chaperone